MADLVWTSMADLGRMIATKEVSPVEVVRAHLERITALDARLRAYATQYTIMENANDLCRLAIRTCGGQAMLKSLALERIYRDSRCGSLMLPWTAEICVDRLGRETLYEPGEKDE